MPLATINDIELDFELAGSGPPVLLIMGLAMTRHAWRLQRDHLVPDHHVLSFDNRGAGASSAPRGAYTTALMARDVLGLLDHVGWDHAHVVGVSLGGMIAQHLALLAPGRVRSLSLIATHGGRSVPTATGLKRWLRTNTTRDPETRRHALASLLFSEATLRTRGPELLSNLGDLADQRSGSWGLVGQTSAAVRHHAHPALHQIRHIPSMVLLGEEDCLIPPADSHALAQGLDAELIRIPEAGHGVMVEAPDRINAALRSFIAQHG